MGVIVEYFIAGSDEDAARMLDYGPGSAGVLGPDPTVELLSLEAILMGIDPSSDEALALLGRPDHAKMVASNATATALVIRIADDTVDLVADAEMDQLSAAMPVWASTEEYVNAGVSAQELAEMFAILRPLLQQARRENRCLYAWICV